MRVLRLGLGDGAAVDLHPAISIVTGLSHDQRATLRQGFTAIGAGLEPGSPGLVEAHGLLLDATQGDLDLLDVPAGPASAVLAGPEIRGDDAGIRELRAAERDLFDTAADGWRARRSSPDVPASGTGPAGDPRPVRQLRARIARHDERDPEPLRRALDEVRDATRAGVAADPTGLTDALAGIGVDASALGLPIPELVRIVEDWLDEHRREGEWVVGARVQLEGIEGSVVAGGEGGTEPRPQGEARLADAVRRVDELRPACSAPGTPDAGERSAHVVARLDQHRPDRLAGAVPLLLDGVLADLPDDHVAGLLDAVAGAAGPVQLVVVDEHPGARAWAEDVGILRAAVVAPVPDAEGPALT